MTPSVLLTPETSDLELAGNIMRKKRQGLGAWSKHKQGIVWQELRKCQKGKSGIASLNPGYLTAAFDLLLFLLQS